MDIPENIYSSIDQLIEIPKINKDAIIHQIRFIQNEVDNLLIEKKASYSKEKIAELFYLLGYIYYLHPDRSRDNLIFQKVEKSLNTAIQLDNKHSMARLYLGHNAYDSQDYILAKKRVDLISRDAIDPYFYLKRLEISLCCSIRTRGLINCLEELEAFIQEAEKYPIEDIYPPSLARTIEDCKNSLPASQHSRLMQLMERLDNASGFTNWFTRLIV